MTRRATFRQVDLARAIKAYQSATGEKPVVRIVGGSAILSDAGDQQPAEAGGNSCDDLFGVTP